MRSAAGAAFAILTMLASTVSALSQNAPWPTKAVHWINTAAPGSSGDIMARIVADRLAAMWGQPIVQDNRPGAAGNLAAQAAARSAPDGYHFFFAVASTLAVNPSTFANVPFNAERDFVPVVMIGFSPFMIAVNPAVPANTMADLIALAKKQPGKLSYATSGTRNLQHITGEMLKLKAGIDLLNVPYRGSPFAANDTIAGRTEVYIDSVPAMSAHIGGDKLRIIAVTSKTRLAGYESIPTVAETVPGFAPSGWFALVAPAGTPPDVLARVNKDVNTVLALQEVKDLLRRYAVFNGGGSLEEVQAFMRAERTAWGDAVRGAGIKPE